MRLLTLSISVRQSHHNRLSVSSTKGLTRWTFFSKPFSSTQMKPRHQDISK
ncbi:hypothetical protein M3J09_007389 [Ascochyta lentis]